MPNFNFQKPMYNFPSASEVALRNAVLNELRTDAEVALYTTTQLYNKVRNNINAKNNPNIDITTKLYADNTPDFQVSNNPYYVQNNNRAYLQTPLGVGVPNSDGQLSTVYNIRFEATNYINVFGQPDITPSIEIPICTLDINNSKRIVSTPLINQSGTVKEVLYTGDSQVIINGILIGYFTKPTAQNPLAGKPLSDMSTLQIIFEANVPIKVTSDYLYTLGIEYLVVENLHFPQDLDMKNIQSFTIQSVSDDPNITII